MPLINLQTNLKNLKYGKDTPGGGYSGQPYIQDKIPVGFEPKSQDFLLRNGYLAPRDSIVDIARLTKMFFDLKSFNGVGFISKQLVLSNSAARTQTSGIFNEGIYTPLNTLAQAGVIAFGGHLNKQGINPFDQTGAYAVGDGLYNSVVKPTQPLEENRLARLYQSIQEDRSSDLQGFTLNDGVNVLSYKGGPGAPLGVGNTNIRYSSTRTGKASGINFDTYQVGLGGSSTQRTNLPNYILNLSSSFAGFGLTIPLSSQGISPFVLNNKLITDVIPSGSILTYQAQGFPLNDKPEFNKLNYQSILSSGSSATYEKLTKTKIDNNIEQANSFNVYTQGNTFPEVSPLVYENNTFTYSQEDLINTTINKDGKLTGSPKIQDFRQVLRAKLGNFKNPDSGITSAKSGATPNSPNYELKNLDNRVNLGNPGQRANKSYISYSSGVLGPDGKSVYAGAGGRGLDKINALPIYLSENVAPNSSTYPVNDLVKFRIAAIDGSNPNFKTFMHFRAFINNFNDSYSADWGSVQYLGRGEKFYNYNGFDRKIALSFTVAAQSKEELIPMYKKLNYLASNLAPDYSPAGYMRGPLVQLTMGGYLYEQVGFITGLTYDVPQDSTWEIGINDQGGDDSTVKELPHRINVNSFSFTPIHSFRPAKQGNTFTNNKGGFVSGYGNERFIALSNGSNTNYSTNP